MDRTDVKPSEGIFEYNMQGETFNNDPGPLPPVLAEIIEHKRTEIAALKAATSIAEFRKQIADQAPARNFFAAVTKHSITIPTAVIAEVKRQSPSAGLIRPEYAGDSFRPDVIAEGYWAAGAAAISCLTDSRFFGGDLSFINVIKAHVPLPVLRKDFIIEPIQLYESRAAGADAVLLIAECIETAELLDLMILAHELKLTVLLEVHTPENLLRVRPHIGFPLPAYTLLGINNRDLSSMTVNLAHTLRMLDLVEDPTILVSESGIKTPQDMKRLRDAGVRIVLVGEHLMRQNHPGLALQQLLEIA